MVSLNLILGRLLESEVSGEHISSGGETVLWGDSAVGRVLHRDWPLDGMNLTQRLAPP